MIHWLSRLLPRRAPAVSPHVFQALRLIRARYDAAATTDENRRHWKHADGLSAVAANSSEVRRLLRNRARYEVANNSYARGIVLTLANDTIGTGPRLQLLTENAEANRRLEREWMLWSRAVGLAEKLRRLVESTRFEFDKTRIPVTISAGVAEWEPAIELGDQLVAAADGKLYEAKGAGRNCVRR